MVFRDFKGIRFTIRPEIHHFGPEISLAWNQPSQAHNQSSQGSYQCSGQTDGWTKVPLCSTGLRPLRGRCPASSHSNSQSCKAGQRVSLTTYCPWTTGFLSLLMLFILTWHFCCFLVFLFRSCCLPVYDIIVFFHTCVLRDFHGDKRRPQRFVLHIFWTQIRETRQI